MSESESEISDFSQTSSETDEEEMEEEDDNVQVIFSQIEPYQDEPLAEDDSTSEGNEVEEEADEDGLTRTVLEARYKERFLLIHGWFNCCCMFQYKLLRSAKTKSPYGQACLPLSCTWYITTKTGNLDKFAAYRTLIYKFCGRL